MINTKEEKDIFEVNKNLRFCGVDLMENKIQLSPPRSKKSKSQSTRHLSTIYRPIRIFVESTYLDSQGDEFPLLKDKIPLLNRALNKAVKAIEALLEVEENDENIFESIDIIQIFKNNIIEKWNPIFNNVNDIKSDFLLIAKIDNTQQLPNGVLASAVPLFLDSETNRPIVGLLTIGSDSSFYGNDKVEEYFSKVLLHELTHALGFLYSMFEYYPGGLNQVVGTKVIRGVDRKFIKTPKVLELAKIYYNCSDIVGVELEDQGGPGSSGSHWDQRILLGEYMGAVIYQEEMAISEFTLALLEDSGWYKANYYTGGLMRFGKNKGCNFIENNCIDPYNDYKTEFGNEFFDYENKGFPSCSTGRQSRTYSLLYVYTSENIDQTYKYNFVQDYSTGSIYSGGIYTTDFCFTHGQNIYESQYFTGNCKVGSGKYGSFISYYNYEKGQNEYHPNSELPKELGETYSDTSFCIMSSLVPTGKYKMYGSVFHPMCYQTYCSSSFLTIQVNDEYIVCPRSGGNIKVNGYDGEIHCPDYNLICTGTVLCNDIFDCIEKKSLVKNESFYYDYQPLTTQQYSELSNFQAYIAYEDSDDGVCPKFCSQCSKNRKCKICLDGYNLVGTNENDDNPVICDNIIDVEKGYYKNADNTYYQCSEGCEKCSKKNNCFSCKENNYFLEDSSFCFNKTNYPKGYYFNETKNMFSKCYKNCETCSSGPISEKEMNCDTCKSDYKFDKKKKNCNEKTSNVFVWVFVPIVIIIIILGALIGFYLWRKKKKSNEIDLNFETPKDKSSKSGVEMNTKNDLGVN